MDCEIDFIQPEFLDILFLEQKNLIIYPYLDLQNLHVLETFTWDATSVDIDANMLHHIEDVVSLATSESDSPHKTFFFIYNIDRNILAQLLPIPSIRCVININEDMKDRGKDLPNNGAYIVYNKKTKKFLNYHPSNVELEFAHNLLSTAPNITELKLNLQKLKNTAEALFQEVNQNPDTPQFAYLLQDYDPKFWKKILHFTETYYHIHLPDPQSSQSKVKKNPNEKPFQPYQEEYSFITTLNQNLAREFLQLLHDYRAKKVNPSNLDLEELHLPQKLYLYLRIHHWNKGIDPIFLTEWLQMNNTNYTLTDQDREDFRLICEKVKVPSETIVQLFKKDAEVIKVKTKVSPAKIEQTTRNKKESENKLPINPSIKDFPHYKQWVLKLLDEIEKFLY